MWHCAVGWVGVGCADGGFVGGCEVDLLGEWIRSLVRNEGTTVVDDVSVVA